MSKGRHVDIAALRSAAAASGSEEARGLASYLGDHPDVEIASSTVPAAVLRPTYGRRLRRYQRSEGPVCHGLERFVQTLEAGAEADASVELFTLQSEMTAWVGLLREDGSLLDVTSVDRA